MNINGSFETSLQTGDSALLVMLLLSFVIAVACGIVVYSIFYLSVTSNSQRLGQYLCAGTTKRQMKGLIRREGLLLTALALPASLTLSGLIAYAVTPDGWSWQNFALLCAIASVCGALTVQLSLRKPAAMAAMISPVEAAHSTASDREIKRHGKSSAELSPRRLALISWSVGRRKWLLTTLSLTFSGVLFMTAATWMSSWDDDAYSRQSGFQDNEYHISYLYDHSYPRTYGITEMQIGGHLSPELEADILALPHVAGLRVEHEAVGNVRYQGASFLQSFYPLTREDAEYFELDAQGDNSYDYLAGHDAIFITNSAFSENVNGVNFTPGKAIMLHYFDGEEHTVELEIAAVSEDMVENGDDRPTFCMADTTVRKLWGDMNTASTFYITAEDYAEYGNELEGNLSSLVEQYPDLSLSTLREQTIEDSGAIRQQKQQIYGISALLIIFGIFNLANTVLSSFAVRRREFSVLESLGMEQRQLKSMLRFESLLQIVPSLLLTLTLGTLCGWTLVWWLHRSAAYLEYSFPAAAAALYVLCIAVLPVVLNSGCLRAMERTPLTQRTRCEE
ncbi:MAG TPA: FtsX-like permease family protein [Candidatus Scatomorpha merdigallinarum]|nr:FtsX-like permease family protein [Candidatus Scatomorpha merdigallinarum]